MRFLIAAAVTIFLFPPAVFTQTEPRKTYHVVNYDLKSGAHLYTETISEVGTPARSIHSVYTDSTNKAFAYKHMTFNASPTVPDYVLVDSRTGYRESVASRSGGFVVTTSLGDQEAATSLMVPDPAAVDRGVIRLVENNWDRLLTGESISLHFIVPEKQSYFRFRITPRRTPAALELTIEPENLLLRNLLDPIRVTLDPQTKRVLEYRGITSLMDKSGRNFRVRAVYQY